MAAMTGRERIECVLHGGQPDAVPTFEWFIDRRVGQALTGSDDPLDIVEGLDIDGVNIRADYEKAFLDGRGDTFRDEWGIVRKITEDCIPHVLQVPIADIERHGEYDFPDPAAPGRFRSLEAALERFGHQRAVVLNLRDGFSDMRDLLGYEQCLMTALIAPEAFSELLDRVVEYNLALARTAVERYDVSILATTDDVANAGGSLISPDVYDALIAPAFRTVIGGYKALGYQCIKHCDGDVRGFIDFWIDAGIDCLDPIDPAAGLTLHEMKATVGDRIALKGNVDCAGALCSGTPAAVVEEVKACLRDGGQGGGLILSSSNTIHRGVRPENYRAMLDALRRYGRYPLEV